MNPLVFALIPAAGIGQRSGALRPKQYVPVAGKTMLEWSALLLLAIQRVDRVVVVVSPDDEYINDCAWLQGHDRLSVLRCGGPSRAHTVLNGLRHAMTAHDGKGSPAWALVHDAARPGVPTSNIDQLIDQCLKHQTGGLLAVPVSDTVKRVAPSTQADGVLNMVQSTVKRDDLWLAQTPQMYPLNTLAHALESGLKSGLSITDESSAMEAIGQASLIVPGQMDNFKVTYPEDFERMGQVLLKRAKSSQALS